MVGFGGDGHSDGALRASFGGVVGWANRGVWEWNAVVGAVTVGGRRGRDDLGRLGDFGGLVVVGWCKHVDEGVASGATRAELVHDLALLVDVAAGTDVDGGRDDDAEPMGAYVSFTDVSVDSGKGDTDQTGA